VQNGETGMKWRVIPGRASLVCTAAPIALWAAGAARATDWNRNTPQERECDRGTDPDTVILACTELLEGGTNGALGIFDDYVGRGSALRLKKQYERSVADFTDAIRIGPQIPLIEGSVAERNALIAMAHFFRARDYLETGQLELAIGDYTKAIDLRTPHVGAAYQGRGMSYSGKAMAAMDSSKGSDAVKYLRLAKADLERAVDLDPRDAVSLEWLGRVKKLLGAYMRDPSLRTSGQEDMDRAKAIDPGIGN
jgi:tetratricopeptide (TPR) repeat protein